MLLALLRKNPVLLIALSRSARGAPANAAAEGYRRNRPGVTRLTRLSVHWAERIVAMSNSSGFEWFNSQWASGYVASKPSMILRVRASLASFDSLGMGVKRAGGLKRDLPLG